MGKLEWIEQRIKRKRDKFTKLFAFNKLVLFFSVHILLKIIGVLQKITQFNAWFGFGWDKWLQYNGRRHYWVKICDSVVYKYIREVKLVFLKK